MVQVNMSSLKLCDADQYYQMLQTGSHEADREWAQLVTCFTNGESYFFRDKGQMALLRERILPELIQRNRSKRSLRIWSAGCSTGEEAYSLAILVAELLPQSATTSSHWEIKILGTDINERSLEHARAGIYGEWSFRTMQAGLQQRCFLPTASGWQVEEPNRSLVRFAKCNLAEDTYPDTASGICDMDLILCRNVFIYLEREAVAAIMSRFALTLSEGGYLMTGHAETLGIHVPSLQARIFPESVLFQRVNQDATDALKPTTTAHQPVILGVDPGQSLNITRFRHPVLEPQEGSIRNAMPEALISHPDLKDCALLEAEDRCSAGDYMGVIRALAAMNMPVSERVIALQAWAHANQGNHSEAIVWCGRYIELCPFASEPYELLAMIAQDQKRDDEAKLFLKKAIYLAPASPHSYLELAEIYHLEGDYLRARKMREAALELLQKLSPVSPVNTFGGPLAQEWLLHLRQSLHHGE